MPTLEGVTDYEKSHVAFLDILGWRGLIERSRSDVALRRRMAGALLVIADDAKRQGDSRQVAQFSDTIVISYKWNTFSLYHLLRDVAHLAAPSR